ncbi:diguanylate cyclase (GGDEF)-like protein [Krasilnikovia cinnamomea]|uniref:Diguanylate cyclase (GGDEF)-like protein n=1 Tax=Krasilnikovia cinnamomea TaxID=349313 RepID=A0A4Q7ZDF0_9ACTN|nr:GGDEF domain-containing protein [Krasilnikovia cinnamomea]RZU48678.1 diguanylate cyclase (GGDEF)-like protein [Krasilnikovia cinnamomea]
MGGSALDTEAVSAALLAMEEQLAPDAAAGLAAAAELERRATALGDDGLIRRARLCRANMAVRSGEITGIAREVFDIQQWAAEHGDRILEARAHGMCALIQRLSGDAAKRLEHSLSAVELLDETATVFTQIWHRTRLADALADTGAMDAARQRYRQAEELARRARHWELLNVVHNNWAHYEYQGGDAARAREVIGRMIADADAHGLELDPPTLHTVGEVQTANGEYAAAEQTMLTCITRYEAGQMEAVADLVYYRLTLARARRGLGDLVRAQEILDACRELGAELGMQAILVEVHEEQADLHAARGDHTAAFAELKAFIAARESVRSREREAQAQARQAMFETTEAREQAERFREQARRDPLTGLHNRRYADEELPTLITQDPELTLAIADIDHFKRINDQLSHDTGDQVLIQVAHLLNIGLTAAVPHGFVARLGGEEFLLALPATPLTTATTILDDIRQAIGGHDWHDITGGLPVTVSIGAATADETSPPNQTATLAAADRNLYAAKRDGRNRVIAGTPRERLPRAYRDRDVA